MIGRPPRPTRTDTLFPYTTLFRSHGQPAFLQIILHAVLAGQVAGADCDEHGAGLVHARLKLAGPIRVAIEQQPLRSDAHTSELQSLMRLSLAVFCLNKLNDNDCSASDSDRGPIRHTHIIPNS